MASDALSSHDPAYGADQHAPHAPHIDDFWLALVGSVDALLRSLHGIHEFTEDPECVLRLAFTRARDPVTLADGTHIGAGEPIGALHLWNEHLPRYSERGPDVAWACETRRRVLHSMRLLGAYIQREHLWRPVRAFSAATTLSNRLGDLQIRRLAARHGFERVEPPPSVLGKLHALGDCFNTWALTRAFNPAALSRQPFLRGRHQLWISRTVLLERYGAARTSAEAEAARAT
ncbi:MAG TPA: hypothetical protein VF007_13585 [Stellaceae bacterium]